MSGRPRLRRYGPLARFYDVLSFEHVYRPGRVAGIAALGLRAGARVLDVGCGTGLNFPLLAAAVGPGGAIVGVDASPVMLRQAARRVAASGWTNVELVRGDAGDLAALLGPSSQFDAVLFTYSLSIIPRWREAWEQAIDQVRPDGRIAVVDMSLPRGRWRALAPLARFACLTGGADPRREPWRAVFADTADVRQVVLRAGHLHVVAGTVSRAPARSASPAAAQ